MKDATPAKTVAAPPAFLAFAAGFVPRKALPTNPHVVHPVTPCLAIDSWDAEVKGDVR